MKQSFGFIKRADKGNYHRERFRTLSFRALALRQLSKSSTVVIQPLSTRLIKPNFSFNHALLLIPFGKKKLK